MNIRAFKSDKQALIEEGKRIIASSDDARFIRKVTIVNLLLNGASASSLSLSCGETARTLMNWVKIVDEQGFEALRPRKQTGRPFRLTAVQKEEIKAALLSKPSDYGYTIWNGPSLSDHINKTYHIDLGVRQCQRLFHELGVLIVRQKAFTSQDPEK